MKQASAIFLMLLLSIHWYGYRFVIDRFQQRADQELEARLDAFDYNEAELVEIRVPLNMPYQSSDTKFERCYGEVIIAGVVHAYVERRIEDGVLVLRCIPNQGKQAIKNAGTDFFRDNNGYDGQQNQQESTPLVKVFKNAFGDCENYYQDFNLNIVIKLRQDIAAKSCDIRSVNIPVGEQPPDAFTDDPEFA